MAGLDSSPWSLAGGGATVFALSVVLDRLPWQAALAATLVAVAAWAWWCRPLTAAGLGVVAWMCVTGFDVHRLGYIGITNSADVVRAVVLVLCGVLAASVPAALKAVRSHGRADPGQVDFREAGITAGITSAGTTGRLYPVPRPRHGGESSLQSHRGNEADG